MSTGFLLIASFLVFVTVWILIEVKTLKDTIPENHITAVIRRAVKKQPGPFMLFMLGLGFLFGHLFWP